MKFKYKLLHIHRKPIKRYIQILLNSIDLITYIASAIAIFALIYEHGFIINNYEAEILNKIYHTSWIIFIIDAATHSILENKLDKRWKRILKNVLYISLYLTLIPIILNFFPQNNITEFISHIFTNKIYFEIILSIIAVQKLSAGIIKLLGRKTNPSIIFAASFFLVIITGALLLMLPRSTFEGISFVNALFISTSATCVTGLTSVDVASTFTPAGLFIIIALIQIGGIGVMTFTCFFAMFFMGNTSLYSQLVIRDLISSESLSSLLSTLLYILGFTLSIEAVGAGIIFMNIHSTLPGFSFNEEVTFSIFHSISAFCNAGFSTLPDNLGNSMLLEHHNILYITISILIILGGLGFPILVNIHKSICYEIKYAISKIYKGYVRPKRKVHIYNLNTRIVLRTTCILLIIGTCAILILEWNNSFSSLSITDKIIQAFFNATLPRTAGFSSINPSLFGIPTILLIIVLMMIGGGTQSTAGGIKVNVFAVIVLNLRSFVYGTSKVTIFNRELSNDSVKRSNATLILYMFIVFSGLFLITIFEPDKNSLSLFFECVSALSTVGSSLNITTSLSTESKYVIIILMFVGRVGALTLFSSIIRKKHRPFYKFPHEEIIIN